jgi:multidrug efflux pump subunit AcrB
VLSTLLAEIYGPDDASRLALASQIKEVFASSEGVADIDWLVEAPQTKQVLHVDHEKAARFNVPTTRVARTLRLALTGENAGRLHLDNELETVTLRIELPRAERSTLADLGSVRVRGLNGGLVPLSELVTVEETTQEATRHRKNLRPVIYVTGDVAGRLESPVYSILDMSEKIDRIELPDGGSVEQFYRDEPFSQQRASLKWDGEWHITYEVFRDLGIAFGAVLILIYMLIIGWFKSFKVPAVMMISIPLSLVGVVPGHWLFGAFFTATSMIGFIALAGIMVRNAVLLIDFVNLALERGELLEDAVIEAGAVRFRPILLTAGTVVVGAMVILFDPIFQGLAIALLTGAIASTVLTLVVVPLVYYLVEGPQHRGQQPGSANTSAEITQEQGEEQTS